MSAWRVPAPPKPPASGTRPSAAPRVDAGFDDDGEPRGGASIRAELNARKALGVAAVVTRAHGGVNLGKARFEHIRERVAVLIQAAGVQSGVMATDDAFRGVGRTLGGVRALAAALGGGVLLESGEEGGGDPGRIGTGETDEPETDEPETDEPDSETCTACDSERRRGGYSTPTGGGGGATRRRGERGVVNRVSRVSRIRRRRRAHERPGVADGDTPAR